jgi:hypothetical protein
MEQSHPLDLAFRGKRSYIHGTDVYTSIVSLIREQEGNGAISLSFHSQILRQPDLIPATESQISSQRESTSFRGDVRIGKGAEAQYWMLMESSREVGMRLPCREAEVVATAMVDAEARTATLPASCAGTPIEQVVFLNKQLHLLALPAPATQWLFARLELRRALPDSTTGEVAVKLNQVLGGRFTRSSISWSGEPIGNIYFSLAA